MRGRITAATYALHNVQNRCDYVWRLQQKAFADIYKATLAVRWDIRWLKIQPGWKNLLSISLIADINEPLYRYVPHIHAEAPLYDINATMVWNNVTFKLMCCLYSPALLPNTNSLIQDAPQGQKNTVKRYIWDRHCATAHCFSSWRTSFTL